MQLIVLGMHRSGTSVLARILNLMGAYLGPEGMSTGANPENPKGFWERRDVRLLNDAVLHSVGCDWDRVANLDLGRVPEEMQQAFDEVARRVLLEMDAHRPWFIKEPRLCVLLPLWLRHLEVPLVVNIHRDPVEVAASLHRRNGMPMEAGLELWEYYTRSAAAASQGLSSITVLHSELMSEPEAVASRLYEELERLGVQGMRRVTPRELAGFIDPGLHRQRGGRGELGAWRDCRQARIYRDLAEGDDAAYLSESPAGDWVALRDYERGLPPVKVPESRKVRASGYDAFMLDERLKSSVRRMSRIEAGMDAKLDERFAKLESEVRARGGRAPGPGSSSPEETMVVRERVERELEQRYAELAVAAQQLAGMLAAKEAVEEKLRKSTRQCRRALRREQALRERLETVQAKLNASRKGRQGMAGSLEQERERGDRLQAELEALTGSRSWRMTAPIRALLGRLRG